MKNIQFVIAMLSLIFGLIFISYKLEKSHSTDKKVDEYFNLSKPIETYTLIKNIKRVIQDSLEVKIDNDTLYQEKDIWTINSNTLYASQDTAKNLATLCFELEKPHYKSNTIESFFIMIRIIKTENGNNIYDITEWSFDYNFLKYSESLFETHKVDFEEKYIEQL